MASAVWALHRAGWRIVLVHGNGPQIGNLAIQQEEGADLVPAQPLFCLDAMTQGQLGSMITMALHQTARRAHVDVATLVTHVVVAIDDPAFDHPSKPIGPFFEESQAQAMARTRGWTMGEDAGRGHRRMVASPQPLRIVEAAALRALVDSGVLVIAAGGGGIPVVAGAHGYSGVDAVVDKDYAAQVLATSLHADALVMLTGVRNVALDFGTPRERPVTTMSDQQAQQHLDAGQFPEGSMGPKVRAGIRFLRAGGHTVVITTADAAAATLREHPGRHGGTRIVAAPSPAGALR
jgi:carbamate kinase